jgi:metal-sulfur cluster biosynthetic enzyme
MKLKNKIIDILKQCYDPEIPIDLWNLGLIYHIDIQQSDNGMSLTTPGCTMGQHMAEDIKAKVSAMQEIGSVDVEVTFDPPWKPEMMTDEAREKLGFDNEVQESQQEQLETTWE